MLFQLDRQNNYNPLILRQYQQRNYARRNTELTRKSGVKGKSITPVNKLRKPLLYVLETYPTSSHHNLELRRGAYPFAESPDVLEGEIQITNYACALAIKKAQVVFHIQVRLQLALIVCLGTKLVVYHPQITGLILALLCDQKLMDPQS